MSDSVPTRTSPALEGYFYQLDVSIFIALELVMSQQVAPSVVLEPASKEDLELTASLKNFEMHGLNWTLDAVARQPCSDTFVRHVLHEHCALNALVTFEIVAVCHRPIVFPSNYDEKRSTLCVRPVADDDFYCMKDRRSVGFML